MANQSEVTSVNINENSDLPLLDNGKTPMAEPPAKRTRLRRRWLLILVFFVIFGSIAVLYFRGPFLRAAFIESAPAERKHPLTPIEEIQTVDVVALGRLRPAGGIVSVALPHGAGDARIKEILVSAGDTVSQGELLATLDSLDQYEAALISAERNLAIKEANLLHTRIQVAAAEAELRAQLRGSEATLTEVRRELIRVRSLFDRGTATQSVLEDAELAVDVAVAERNRLHAALSRYQREVNGFQSDVAVALADKAAASAAVAQARSDLDHARVFAPQAGIILDVAVRTGERVPSEGVLQMGQTAQMEVELEVFQTLAPRVRVGQEVSVSSEVFGEPPLHGRVSRIGTLVGKQAITADDPAANTDARILEVLVELDGPSSVRAAKYVNLEVIARIIADKQSEQKGGTQ